MRCNLIVITEPAQKKYVELLKDREANTNIRIFVENPGTEKASCGMSFCPLNMYDQADLVYEYEGFKLIVDPISDPFLSDAVVDVKDGEFTLRAPSISRNMLDPTLPLRDRINFVILTEVNPGIASHGGAVEIVDFLQPQNELHVKFHGGCVGCASVGITIKDALSKKLNSRFPNDNIKVIDKTEHKVTSETYKG